MKTSSKSIGFITFGIENVVKTNAFLPNSVCGCRKKTADDYKTQAGSSLLLLKSVRKVKNTIRLFCTFRLHPCGTLRHRRHKAGHKRIYALE
jgi:hypothetical protein